MRVTELLCTKQFKAMLGDREGIDFLMRKRWRFCHFHQCGLLLAIAASARNLRYYLPATEAARRLNFTLSIVLL